MSSIKRKDTTEGAAMGSKETSREDDGDSCAARMKSSRGSRARGGEEVESKSVSSDNNIDGASADDQDTDAPGTRAPGKRRGRKACYRHTQQQIQEMERAFKECPHPDEKARLELSKVLNLDPRQVKFWFQNKRTQMKTQQERHDNTYLRNENDKLRAEIKVLREAVNKIVCSHCGALAVKDSIEGAPLEEQWPLVENGQPHEEVYIAPCQLGQTPVAPITPDDLSLLPVSNNHAPSGPTVAEIASHPLCLTDAEKLMVVELAVSAMEELAQVAQAGEPLWVLDLNSSMESLDFEEYLRQFKAIIGPSPPGLTTEATRESGVVMMDARSVIETFMDVDLWAQMFSSIICQAKKVEMLSSGPVDPFDGAMQVVYAELQLPTPFIPTREAYFLRYSKKVEHQWLIVDVCVDSLRANPPPSLLRCRKRPSGCVLEETANGYAKITWVEHVEADNTGVYPIYQSLVKSGVGFGAQLWVATLQRQCARIASLLANGTLASSDRVLLNHEGRRSMLKLAERMTNNFCAGVSGSTKHSWITLSGAGSDEFKVVIRESVDDPGRPPGIVLSAATSLHLPVSPVKLFQFLCDHTRRTEWDILSNMGVVEEMVCVSKGEDFGNTVSLLKINSASSNPSNSLILQDCFNDKSCSMVVYALVDVEAMKAVLNGGDSDVVTLLPSGFAILPDRYPSPPYNNYHPKGGISNPGHSSRSLLTMAFQILVDHELSAKLSLESVATINNLISSTISRIKTALSCDEM